MMSNFIIFMFDTCDLDNCESQIQQTFLVVLVSFSCIIEISDICSLFQSRNSHIFKSIFYARQISLCVFVCLRFTQSHQLFGTKSIPEIYLPFSAFRGQFTASACIDSLLCSFGGLGHHHDTLIMIFIFAFVFLHGSTFFYDERVFLAPIPHRNLGFSAL